MEKLFNDLESNNLQQYEDTKQKFTEFFSQTKDQWLVNGMLDYYLTTSSERIIEILVKVQAPHDTYIFDRLSDWINKQNRIPSLSVFGFIVRKHPTWLYKVAKHRLMKDILKLLQNEKEIIPLMSALISVITLLPIIPSLVPYFLSDLFDVFGHLASWNCQNPNKLSEYQLIHLQLGLYTLFHRLYGMYPCHFISYLREFKDKDKGAIFHHTIKPLLETVRIHPMLVIGTKESEINSIRWKEMEPHDVVVECDKFSLGYYHDNSECFGSSCAYRSHEPFSSDIPVSVQLQASINDTKFQYRKQLTSGFSSPLHSFLQKGFVESENLWSPSVDILQTPPPTSTVPHTPTPSYVGVPLTNLTNTGNLLGGTGASPPEAAVEATPETTPMKDISLKRTIVLNSPAIRAILPSSQPSSPMRKEQSPFNFPESSSGHLFTTVHSVEQTTTASKITTSQRRLLQLMNERNQHIGITNTKILNLSTELSNQQTTEEVGIEDIQQGNKSFFTRSNFMSSLDSPTNFTESTQDDLETTTGLTTSQHIEGGPRHSDTLQDISNEYDDNDETERSPCSVGGLHAPTNRSMQILAERIKRNRMTSYCYNDTSSYLSYGTSPADTGNSDVNYVSVISKAKVRRVKSWHAIEHRHSIDGNNYVVDINGSYLVTDNNFNNSNGFRYQFQQRQHDIAQQNGDSSSPSGDDAISAATHFNKIQQKKERKSLFNEQKQKQLTRQNLTSNQELNSHLFNRSFQKNKQNTETQTIQQWPQVCECNLLELLAEENRSRNKLVDEMKNSILQPTEILEQFIEHTVKMKQCVESRNREEALKEQIQLLNLQLQFERHRREIHSEHNRRLLGKSRELRSLQMDNDRLRDQLNKLQDELQKLTVQNDSSRRLHQQKKLEIEQQCNTWKTKYHTELEDNKKLRLTIENLQRRLNEEIKQKSEMNYEIEALRGEIFDLRNDMQQAQCQAELGTQYKLELTKLESEFLVMGEIQVKCRDKLNELDNQKAKENEMEHRQEAFIEEIKELRNIVEIKSAQLEAARQKLNDIQTQLINKEAMFTDQKRLLKSVKEEYEEKFKALNNKYEVQKSIILSMEQNIFELYKSHSAVNLEKFSTDSDKADIAGSIDHTSPLSLSLASSEGLSASLRSSSELRNLQALVNNTASGNTIITTVSNTSLIPTTITTTTAITTIIPKSNILTSSLMQQQKHQQISKRGSNIQHHHNVFPTQHQQQMSSTKISRTSTSNISSKLSTLVTTMTTSGTTATVNNNSTIITSLSGGNINSSNVSSLSRLGGTSTRHSTSSDIPVPGTSQHLSNLRHHR